MDAAVEGKGCLAHGRRCADESEPRADLAATVARPHPWQHKGTSALEEVGLTLDAQADGGTLDLKSLLPANADVREADRSAAQFDLLVAMHGDSVNLQCRLVSAQSLG